MSAAIEVRGIEKSYGKLEVLKGVDFEVAPGSIFALLGSNGAGKTTVVKVLSTLLKADAGTASVNGFDVAMQLRRDGGQKPGFVAERKIKPADAVGLARLEFLAASGEVPPGFGAGRFRFFHGTISLSENRLFMS